MQGLSYGLNSNWSIGLAEIWFYWSSKFSCWSKLSPFFRITHKNSVGLGDQLQQKSTSLAKKSVVEDQQSNKIKSLVMVSRQVDFSSPDLTLELQSVAIDF